MSTTDGTVRLVARDAEGRVYNLNVTRGDAASLAAQLVSRGLIAPGVLVRRVRHWGDARRRHIIVGPCPWCGRPHTHGWPRVQLQPGEQQAPCGPDRRYLPLATPGQLAGTEEKRK